MAAEELTQYIDEHLAEDVFLSSLAELVHMSPYHFSCVFKQSFNMPSHRYPPIGASNTPRTCWRHANCL
jgi:AraC-like DNA-binding protein